MLHESGDQDSMMLVLGTRSSMKTKAAMRVMAGVRSYKGVRVTHGFSERASSRCASDQADEFWN